MPARPINGSSIVDEPFVLVTPTTGYGRIPPTVASFLKINGEYLLGVAGSGNRNWGDRFAMAGKLVSHIYSVPLLHTFELSGTDEDVRIFIEKVNTLE